MIESFSAFRAPRRASRAALFDAALLVAALSTTFARAASLTWDAGGLATSTSTATDGGGTWSTTTPRWNNNATDLVWSNAAGDVAIIGNNNGTGGVLNLATPITAAGLIFNAPASGSYTLSGSTLTLSGARTITTNANATIASALSAGGGTLTKNGTGSLTLSGAVSGAISAAAGTLVVQSGTNATTSYAIASGAVLEFNVATTSDTSVATSFSGAGTLRKTGAGTISWGVLPATFALSSGALIDVQQGRLTGGSNANENWINNRSDLRVASGAVFSTPPGPAPTAAPQSRSRTRQGWECSQRATASRW